MVGADHRVVNDAELGGVVKALRHRRGWRQIDVAGRAGVSAALISLLERGQADALSVRSVRRICATLEVRLGWDAGYRGAELARLRDADHARLAEWLAGRVAESQWTVVPEASFNHYGDRGRIDLLAYHRDTRGLLVVEIKTVIAEIQELLGSINAKARVAATVARSLDWQPRNVIPMLVVADTTTNRRRLSAHARLFARLTLRGKAAVAWIRRPEGAPTGLLLLVKLPNSSSISGRRAGRQRIRPTRARASVGGSRQESIRAPERA